MDAGEIEFKSAETLQRERELEDLLLGLDVVEFAGATRVGADAAERVTYKLVVGARPQHAVIAAMAVEAALGRVKWAEEAGVVLEAMLVLGRARGAA